MKTATNLVILTFSITALGYEAAVPYFAHSRSVAVSLPDHQNYVVVDADTWKSARNDLSDIRIYDGQSQVPYALIKESGGSSNQETAAKILNLGSVGGHTEFDLDVGGLQQYERVRLEVDAKNFINGTQVQGRGNRNDRSGSNLGSSTLYDFTAEGLGSNFALKFPTSSFPYLHVRLSPGILPTQVKRAFVSSFSETKAAWSPAGDCKAITGAPKEAVFECSLFAGVPLERLAFDLPASTVNFNRTVIVSDEKGNELERGAISRVRLNRAGQSVVSEDLTLDLYGRPGNKLKVAIQNGDDKPLPIENVRALSFERRIYFDPNGKTALRLYYGDDKLGSPTYDYAKLFQQSPNAAVAQLGSPEENPQFTGRPDERPWSERHQVILWAAMVAAVALLGSLALRGMKSGAASG
jgi:Protein of unknown function (DUF3999)